MTPRVTSLTSDVHTLEAPQRFLGMALGARMTVLSLSGGLLVCSPLNVSPDVLAPLGTPRWLLAPNLFHHLYAGSWLDAGLEGWAAPGLAQKRRDLAFHHTVAPDSTPFGPDVALYPLSCLPLTNEVVVHHRPSKTLIVTDLVFNVPASAPWFTRTAMRCLCGYPGCKTTLLERTLMKRARARQEIGTLLALDFDRLILAHGEIIGQNGRDALAKAFRWLF